MFSALRQGSVLYILDKTGEPTIKTGYVDNVTAPRPMYKTYNPAVSFGTNMQTVVDITVKLGDEKKEICGLSSNSTIDSYGDYVVSETREAMISEVDAMLQNSKSIIESVDKHKANIAACEKILKELNPVYAKEQERDDRIDNLAQRVDDMQDSLSRIENILTRNNNENYQGV